MRDRKDEVHRAAGDHMGNVPWRWTRHDGTSRRTDEEQEKLQRQIWAFLPGRNVSVMFELSTSVASGVQGRKEERKLRL